MQIHEDSIAFEISEIFKLIEPAKTIMSIPSKTIPKEIVRKQLAELERNGFVTATKDLSRYIYNHRGDVPANLKKLSIGASYNPLVLEVFGVSLLSFYYDTDRKAALETHLESMFHAKNLAPSRQLTDTFTRLMHSQDFHWSGCCNGRRVHALLKVQRCLYCGEDGHPASRCPNKPSKGVQTQHHVDQDQ